MPIHGNLVRYYDSEIYNEENLVRGVIITEHCDGGLLSDVVTQTYPQTFSEKMLLAILRDVACALFVLHTEDPPISYRNVNVRDPINRPDLLAQLHLRPCEWSLQTGSRALYDFQHDRICVSASERQTPHTMEESRIVEQQLELVADPAYFPPEFCDLSLSFLLPNSQNLELKAPQDLGEGGRVGTGHSHVLSGLLLDALRVGRRQNRHPLAHRGPFHLPRQRGQEILRGVPRDHPPPAHRRREQVKLPETAHSQTTVDRGRGGEGLRVHALANDAGSLGRAGLRAAAASKARADEGEKQENGLNEIEIDVCIDFNFDFDFDFARAIEQTASHKAGSARQLGKEHVFWEILDAVGAERLGFVVEQRGG